MSLTADMVINPPSEDQPVPEQEGKRVHLVRRFTYDGEQIWSSCPARGAPILRASSRAMRALSTISLPDRSRGVTPIGRASRWVPGSSNSAPSENFKTTLREVAFTRNAAGDITRLDARLDYPRGSAPVLYRHATLGTGALPRGGAPPDAVIGPHDNHSIAYFDVDEFGSVVRRRGAFSSAQSCTMTSFDAAYKQFPETVTAHPGNGCTGGLAGTLVTQLTFDRGLGALASRLAPGSAFTTMAYDAHGRLSEVWTPVPEAGPFATTDALQLEYVSFAKTPHVKVSRRVGDDEYLRSIEIFNALGEHVLGFDEAGSECRRSRAGSSATGWSETPWVATSSRTGRGSSPATQRASR